MDTTIDKVIDLHTHSNCSDGSMTPTELVRHAKANGISAIALSDHDGVAGVEEAMEEGRKVGVEVVPAIEFSAISDTETHILGYYIDINSKHIKAAVALSQKVRYEREVETAEKLQSIGFDVTMSEAEEMANGSIVCRAHFAKLMVQKGYASSVKEAFDKYLSNGKPAYSSKQALTDEEAIAIIKNSGGLAFCAHLHLTRKPLPVLTEFLLGLKAKGLSGIEGYYTEYTPQMQAEYQGLASSLGLLISGGTDFHGVFKPQISIGTGYGNLRIPYSVLENIKEHI